MSYLIIALKGIAYGVTHVVPGLGGGIALLLMGIYEQFVEAVGNILIDRQGLARRLRFLIPLGLGMVVGIVLAAKILAGFLEGYPVATSLFLMGLLLGTIPGVFRLHGDMRPRPVRIVALLLGLAVVVGINIIRGQIAAGSRLTAADLEQLPGAAYNLLVCFLAGGASVTPGLDGSMVLILGGTYEPVLAAVGALTHLDLRWLALGTTGVGALAGIVIFSKSIDALIKRSPSLAYYNVLGLILGSIYALWPQEPARVAWWVLVLALLAGVGAALALAGREPDQQ